MSFWHGGNLHDNYEAISQKRGRYEYGPGLYLITKYDEAIKYTKGQRKFYIDNNIDYNIVYNPFGWGEKMMVLFNMRKIVNIKRIFPKDKISQYDL